MASKSIGTQSVPPEQPIRDLLTSLRTELAAKGRSYWLRLLLFVFLGAAIGGAVSDLHVWVAFKCRLYQFLQKFPNKPSADNTVVVTIGDEEYWNGDLERRVPVKRDYLATLVEALAKLNPAVIALDFDLRGEPGDSTQYATETHKLVLALKAVAEESVVCAKDDLVGPKQELYSRT